MLALVGLYDELWSGVAVVAAPGVEQSYTLDHGWYAFLVFALPMLLAAAIEAPIAVLSDRIPRRRVLCAGLSALAAALLVCAAAHDAWLLSFGLSLAGAASGVTCGVAQAELVATHPGGADRAMSRWTAFAASGDVLSPLFVAAAVGLGASYRAAFVAVAALIFAQALLVARPGPSARAPSADGESAPPPLARALRDAAREPRLLWLLAACAFCTLLDELVIALAALRLHEAGWSEPAIAAALTACSAGAVAGAVACERVLAHRSAPAVLIAAAVTSMASLAVFVACPVPWLRVTALGCAAAPHYALVKAAAYAALPGSPGIVNALAQCFVGLEIALPIAVGAVASRFGLDAALVSLAAEPLVVLAVAIALSRAVTRTT